MKKSKKILGSVLALLMLFGVMMPMFSLSVSAAAAANDDWVVVDFGLPVRFNLTKNDTEVSGTITVSTSESAGFSGSATGEFGTLDVVGTAGDDKQVKYTPTKIMWGVDTFYYTVDGVTAKIEVIPASTMYYEDSFNAKTSGSLDDCGVLFTGNWSVVTSDGDPLGEQDGNNSNNSDDPDQYGYDNAYGFYAEFSGGEAHASGNDADGDMPVYDTDHGYTVSPTAGWQVSYAQYLKDKNAWLKTGFNTEGSKILPNTAQFKFRGTGFDIISYMSDTAGVIKVDVANANAPATIVKTVSVSNYYTDVRWQIDPITVRGLPYYEADGTTPITYIVTVTCTWQTSAQSKSNYVVFDGFRIYDPLGPDTSKYALIEKEAKVLDIPKLAASGGYDGNAVGVNGIAAITPSTELWLTSGMSLVFALDATHVSDPAMITAQLESRLYVGSNVQMQVECGNKSATFNVQTATGLYYDLFSLLGITPGKQVYYFTVTMVGSGWDGTSLVAMSKLKIHEASTVSVGGNPDLTSFDLKDGASSIVGGTKTVTQNANNSFPEFTLNVADLVYGASFPYNGETIEVTPDDGGFDFEITPQGQITITPTAVTTGTEITVTVTDKNNSAVTVSKTFTLVVNPNKSRIGLVLDRESLEIGLTASDYVNIIGYAMSDGTVDPYDGAAITFSNATAVTAVTPGGDAKNSHIKVTGGGTANAAGTVTINAGGFSIALAVKVLAAGPAGWERKSYVAGDYITLEGTIYKVIAPMDNRNGIWEVEPVANVINWGYIQIATDYPGGSVTPTPIRTGIDVGSSPYTIAYTSGLGTVSTPVLQFATDSGTTGKTFPLVATVQTKVILLNTTSNGITATLNANGTITFTETGLSNVTGTFTVKYGSLTKDIVVNVGAKPVATVSWDAAMNSPIALYTQTGGNTKNCAISYIWTPTGNPTAITPSNIVITPDSGNATGAGAVSVVATATGITITAGTAAAANQKFTVAVKDPEGNVIGTKEITVNVSAPVATVNWDTALNSAIALTVSAPGNTKSATIAYTWTPVGNPTAINPANIIVTPGGSNETGTGMVTYTVTATGITFTAGTTATASAQTFTIDVKDPDGAVIGTKTVTVNVTNAPTVWATDITLTAPGTPNNQLIYGTTAVNNMRRIWTVATLTLNTGTAGSFASKNYGGLSVQVIAGTGNARIVSANLGAGQNGQVTVEGTKSGTITLRFTDANSSYVFNSPAITVYGPTAATFSPTTLPSIGVGETSAAYQIQNITINGTSTASTNARFTGAPALTFEVRSSNISVFTVSVNQLVMAATRPTYTVQGVGAGTANVEFLWNGNVVFTQAVTVSAPNGITTDKTPADQVTAYADADVDLKIMTTWSSGTSPRELPASGNTFTLEYDSSKLTVTQAGSTSTLKLRAIATSGTTPLKITYNGFSITVTVSLEATKPNTPTPPATWEALTATLNFTWTNGITYIFKDVGSLSNNQVIPAGTCTLVTGLSPSQNGYYVAITQVPASWNVNGYLTNSTYFYRVGDSTCKPSDYFGVILKAPSLPEFPDEIQAPAQAQAQAVTVTAPISPADLPSIILAGTGRDMVGAIPIADGDYTNIFCSSAFNAVRSMGVTPVMAVANGLTLIKKDGKFSIEDFYKECIPAGDLSDIVILSVTDSYTADDLTPELIAAMESLLKTIHGINANAKIILLGSQGDYDRFMKKAVDNAGLKDVVTFTEDITSSLDGAGAVAEQEAMEAIVLAAINSVTGAPVDPDPVIPDWAVGTSYKPGDVVIFDGQKFECKVAHAAKTAAWTPSAFPQFWNAIN